MFRDLIIRILGGLPSAAASHLAEHAVDVDRRIRAATRKTAELELEVAGLRAELAAARIAHDLERLAGAEVVIAAARTLGKLALVGDERLALRLMRIAKEDGLAALAAELAEFPDANPTTEVLS